MATGDIGKGQETSKVRAFAKDIGDWYRIRFTFYKDHPNEVEEWIQGEGQGRQGTWLVFSYFRNEHGLFRFVKHSSSYPGFRGHENAMPLSDFQAQSVNLTEAPQQLISEM